MLISKDLDMETTWGYDMRSTACRALAEVFNPELTGWEKEPVKKDLYYMILWLQEEYKTLPKFIDEERWQKDIEQQFIIDKLSSKS